MIPVILSGGSGTRLWPLSRQSKPKQFLALTGQLTMLQNTMKRVEAVPGIQKPIIVCNEEHRFIVAEQLREIGVEHQGILLEPLGRDTAPAITLAAFHTIFEIGDQNLLILPSDHVINDEKSFRRAVQKANNLANESYPRHVWCCTR